MSRSRSLCTAAVFFLAAAAAFANVLPNGLELTRFEVRTDGPAVPGATVTVEMVLTNIGGESIGFDRNTDLFVAARVNSTSDANNRDFGHGQRGLVLEPGASIRLVARRTLDAPGEWRFWPGFKLANGAWGPFRWMEKTLTVSPPGQGDKDLQTTGGEQARTEEKGFFARLFDRIRALFGSSGPSGPSNSGGLSVAHILADPARYDGQSVTVEGNALVVRQKGGGILLSLADTEQPERVLSAFGPGSTEARNGDKVRVSGVFKRKSPRGRYTYDNEIEMASGGIAVVEKDFFVQKELQNKVWDYRTVVRAPFNPPAAGARLFASGQPVPVRFHTRLYTNSPRFHTLVREGTGTAAWQLVRWEKGYDILGPGPDGPKSGRTFVAVHLQVRGDSRNEGDPGKWFQFPAGQDPTPCFFLVGRDGSVTWPALATLVVVNRDRAYTNLDNIPLSDPGWKPTALVFDPPEAIQDPVLLAVTWPGGDSFEFTAVRLSPDGDS